MARKDPKKCQEIRSQIKLWDDNWKYNRDQYHRMNEFILGKQWNEEESKVLVKYSKLPMTMNKIAALWAHVAGEQRQNTPNLQVDPESGVDEQTAEIRSALVKDISLSSHAKIVYQIAFQQAGVGGFGAYLVVQKYEDDKTFNQIPAFEDVKDPTRCFWDMGAMTPCKTDGMYAGNRTRMTRKKFKAIYGKKFERQIPTSSEENTYIAVADDDSITVIDYYEREYDTETLYQLSDGNSVLSDEYKNLVRQEIDGEEVLFNQGQPVSVLDTRDVPKYTVKHSKIAGDFILEETDFASQQLPVVFVDQNSYYDKRGRQVCRPLFKDAEDAQKYLNYIATQSAYLLKISRYDQFIVSRQNVRSADTRAIWTDPTTVQGGLVYDESPNGNKPEQLRPPELSQSLLGQYERALMDIQTSTGMYNTQMGEQGNEISGDAIDARTKRGSYNTYVPYDSLNRAITCGGEIVNEMIPILFDTERTMKLNLKDKGMTEVTLNKQPDEYGGGDVQNDMTKGSYKIRLVAGPSYEGQKQENLQSIQMVLQNDPELFHVIGDLYVENLPLANNIELKNRVRTIIDPNIIQAGKTGEPMPPKQTPPDPMIMIKIQELQQKQQAAQMQAQQKMFELQLKEQAMLQQAHQAGVDFSSQIQKLQLEKAGLEAQAEETKKKYDAEIMRTNADVHMHHTGNIKDILVHQPNHFKAPPTPKEGTVTNGTD